MSFQFDEEWLRLTPTELEARFAGQRMPEAVKMYLAIQLGSRMESGEGWFGPAESRYDWRWLANRHAMVNGTAAGAAGRAVDDWTAHEVTAHDWSVTAEQFVGARDLFERLDRNRDGRITVDDLDWSERNPWVEHAYLVNRLFRKLNSTGDGRLTRAQWDGFFERVAAGRDYVTSNDLRDEWLTGMTASFLPGDAPTREQLLRGFLAGEVGSMSEGPAVDQPAPDFTLTTVDGRSTIRLSDCWGGSRSGTAGASTDAERKPVVLVFGNFTCGPFRSMYAGVEDVYRRFADRAHFFLIYVREAHPTDGWAMRSNEMVGVSVEQPKSFEARREVARQCQTRLLPSIPLLVDDIDDSTGHAYSGMPARLYVIDRRGRVAYKGGRGPFGFKTGEMEQALVMTLLDESDEPKPRVAVDVSSATVAAVRSVSESPAAATPSWYRALSPTLPRTAAQMLQLDAQVRTTEQLTAVDRGLIRAAVARVNRSRYGAAYARAALSEAGVETSTVNAVLAGDDSPLDEHSRRLAQFVSQLSRAGRDVTDEQVEWLLGRYGDATSVAVVLSTAYGNFQDRLVQALGLPVEEQGPVPPATQPSTAEQANSDLVAPERPPLPGHATGDQGPGPQVTASFEALQERLENQRRRESRIRIPEWDEVREQIPAGLYASGRPIEIRWSRLVVGRQPQIGGAWIKTLRMFESEARQNRVFEESMFWVVTRALQCGYCMGHCEMLMEVGGLDRDSIAERTRALATGEWERFPKAERVAYALAEKMTDAPWSVTDAGVTELEAALGHERAIDAIWWIARCQFMTKVSDAFQLSLERENVFLRAYS